MLSNIICLEPEQNDLSAYDSLSLTAIIRLRKHSTEIAIASCNWYIYTVSVQVFIIMYVIALDSCREEGDLTIDEIAPAYMNSGDSYHLLKVCLFGHWSYVCHNRFNGFDRSIVLYQLGCESGCKIPVNIFTSFTVALFVQLR